jgi:hypothetical protein
VAITSGDSNNGSVIEFDNSFSGEQFALLGQWVIDVSLHR